MEVTRSKSVKILGNIAALLRFALLCSPCVGLCIAAVAPAHAFAPSPAANSSDDDEPVDTSVPGLLVRYTMPDGAVVRRIEPLPRLPGLCATALRGPELKLPADRSAVEWNGLLAVPGDGDYVFTARTSGFDGLKIAIGGKPVTLGSPAHLSGGPQPLQINIGVTRSAAFLELWWRGAAFDDEPIAPRFYRHDPAAEREKETAAALAESRSLNRGAVLAELNACLRCHSDPTATSESLCAGLRPDRELLPGPRLDGVGQRLRPQWILQRLTDQKPAEGSRMPVVFGSSPEEVLSARIVATYLAGPQPPGDPKAPPHRGERGEQLFKAAGCAVCHSTPKGIEPDFQLTSTVPSLYGMASKWTPQGLIAFLHQPLELRPHGRMPDEHLTKDDATALADYLFSGLQPEKSTTAPPPPITNGQVAEKWRAMGEDPAELRRIPLANRVEAVALRIMTAKRCFSCHDLSVPGQLQITRTTVGEPKVRFLVGSQLPLKPLGSLKDLRAPNLESGCLATAGKHGAAPDFNFTDQQRHDLAAHYSAGDKDSTLSSLERLRIDMAIMNCARCHDNEGQESSSLAALVDGTPDGKLSTAADSLPRRRAATTGSIETVGFARRHGDKALRPSVTSSHAGLRRLAAARIADAARRARTVRRVQLKLKIVRGADDSCGRRRARSYIDRSNLGWFARPRLHQLPCLQRPSSFGKS